MKLKGNIKSEKLGPQDITTVGHRSHPQIKVADTYLLTGVDLSDLVAETADEDAIDHALDQFKVDLKADLEKELASQKLTEDEKELFYSAAFVGIEADITLLGESMSFENLKDMKLQIELMAFYDVPVKELSSLIEKLAASLV